jgi:hypothetical protein
MYDEIPVKLRLFQKRLHDDGKLTHAVTISKSQSSVNRRDCQRKVVFQLLVLETWKANKEKKYVMIIRNLEKWLKSKGFEKI